MLFIKLLLFSTLTHPVFQRSPDDTGLLPLSQQLLYNARTGGPVDSIITELAKIEPALLAAQLKTDAQKKAFWLNIYNAYTQVILTENTGAYKNRRAFFGKKQIRIAGMEFSLDDIEHGILRRSKIKWSLGYLNKTFPSGIEKKLRVEELDYRIHFALNCGAKSCPPIAFYDAARLDQQLEIATKVYLSGESTYNEKENRVYVPAIMGWFRGDFGGKKGILSILRELHIIPPGKSPFLEFKKYDWNLFLRNYKNEQDG
ncbi:DUF547 domain-containing protein [Chitinophaga barathri]|uniref:DUF547 domain-containing protein n=1 Tax=Chitinophaga barathri TaxID=1647451 RepID=UPI0013C44BEA|nr:DUF547 domain-containing protein [Chitinophaga barathri]